jgi:CRP-like cAMP-binding protein
MSQQERSQLESLATQAQESGQLEKALELYRRLEEIDPHEISWPKRQAAICRQLELTEQELEALLRTGDLYNAQGYFVQAVDAFKIVLAVDPFNVVAQQRLSGQQSAPAVSVSYAEEESSSADDTSASFGPGEVEESDAPLDELVLTTVVESARAASLADLEPEGITEIPLDDPGDELAGEFIDLTDAVDELPSDPRELLAQAPLFASLEPHVLRELVQGARIEELAAGRELFRQGDPADALYMVTDGAVVPIAEGQVRRKLAVLEKGEFFGEIALFTNQGRNATIQALIDTQLLAIDRTTVRKLVAKHPPVLAVLLRFIRERLIDRLVRTSPLFEVLERHERGDFVRQFRFLEVTGDKLLVTQHAPAEALFLLLAGQMKAVHFGRDGEKTLGVFGPGDVIGEMSLISREPSLASVVTCGKCWVLALPLATFRRILQSYPRVKAALARLAKEREEHNRKTLRNAEPHREGRIDII